MASRARDARPAPNCLRLLSMIREFLPTGPTEAIEGYRALRDELGRRPSVLEVSSQGFLPRSISAVQGSWFGFAESEGDLSNTYQAGNLIGLGPTTLKNILAHLQNTTRSPGGVKSNEDFN